MGEAKQCLGGECACQIIKILIYVVAAFVSVWMVAIELAPMLAGVLLAFWFLWAGFNLSPKFKNELILMFLDVKENLFFWVLISIPFAIALTFTIDLFVNGDLLERSIVANLTQLNRDKLIEVLIGLWSLLSVTTVSASLLRREFETVHAKKVYGWFAIICALIAFILTVNKVVYVA